MEYKEFAINMAKEAGDVIRKNFRLGMKKEWKEDKSPVTETDIAVNRLVIESIKEYFPDHNVKGEEASHLVNISKYLWVCDPIDGTMPFSHGVPIFTFSLALVKDGVSILGVIYDPIMDRLFVAEKDKGATLNGEQIHVNSKSTGYVNIETLRFPSLVESLRNQDFQQFKFGCATYGGIMVACGEFVGTIYREKHAHDIAALKVIVEEAGGKVTDIRGNEQRYDQDINGAIISNGIAHDLLVKEVSKVI
ncbi:MAG: Inositol-phosphate phosphatase [Parcubacteria group bacterium GW2011_GWF2_38_76]|nr:MAG: Inositol-phosphate phosphatase [Parcubacteria group bacterium GW2011_GWF2_38_76]